MACGHSPSVVSLSWHGWPVATVPQWYPCHGVGGLWPQSLGGVPVPAWVARDRSPSELYACAPYPHPTTLAACFLNHLLRGPVGSSDCLQFCCTPGCLHWCQSYWEPPMASTGWSMTPSRTHRPHSSYPAAHGQHSPQVQGLAFSFAELCVVPISPFIQLSQVSLNGSMTIQYTELSSCRGCASSHPPGH